MQPAFEAVDREKDLEKDAAIEKLRRAAWAAAEAARLKHEAEERLRAAAAAAHAREVAVAEAEAKRIADEIIAKVRIDSTPHEWSGDPSL